MADTNGSEIGWNIREDGCLPVDVKTNSVTYNSPLNAIIVSSKDQKITVYDALSGAFLQSSDLSGHKGDQVKCVYLPEKDKTVYSDGYALGVRGDLQGILLLDTALQTPVTKADEIVKIELPLSEAIHLLKTMSAIDMLGKEYADDIQRDLAQGIAAVQEASQGNHKTTKWATVSLEMQHTSLKSVFSLMMEELSKSSPTSQGYPVTSAIVDRLGFLLPSSRLEISKEPVNKNLMYSEAARRETFSNWPHMNYKWALPESMAQAGFFHHPSPHGDDRAMCFTCSVCLVCWEPTDEPWSEHERHSQFCPYIKGDYTQNVPLTVTYATQPAQFHGTADQEKMFFVSTTFNEDFVATSTRDGNIVVWDISHLLKKFCQFSIDLGDAKVALKTGLQIERFPNQSYSQKENVLPGSLTSTEDVEEIFLHSSTEEKVQSHNKERPGNDFVMTAVCIADEAKWREENASVSPRPTFVDAQLSLICGVSLRRTNSDVSNFVESQDDASGVSSNSLTVELMNQVNEAVSSESQLITEQNNQREQLQTDFVLPDSRIVPYLLVISVTEESTPLPSEEISPVKKKSDSSPQVVKFSVKEPTMDGSGLHSDWGVPPWEDQGDSDCQIIGFTPPPFKNSNQFPDLGASPMQHSCHDDKHIHNLDKSDFVANGPSDLLCDNVDAVPAMSPSKSFSFAELSFSSIKPFSFASSNESINHPNPNSSPKKDSTQISGNILQCLELPEAFQHEHIEVSTILPSLGKQHVIVILNTHVSYLDICTSESVDNLAGSAKFYGGVLVYSLRTRNNKLVLEDTPMASFVVSSAKEVITSSYLLPMEVKDQVEEQARLLSSRDEVNGRHVLGHLVLTTANGAMKILSVADLSVVAELSPSDGEKFISTTYCSGIERICVCSDNGKLYFFDLETSNERTSSPTSEGDGIFDLSGDGLAVKRARMDDDVVDGSGLDLLINQPLNAETLLELHSLTQFENLMPRFTAVVPPCWTEIQQEQQQRRHPQHLQQQGESMQHTRTWKLTQDQGNLTWDEHLLEILLPKPCSVGHVDLKFSLNNLSCQHPNIEVTLLKQNIGSMHKSRGQNTSTKSNDSLSSGYKTATNGSDQPQSSFSERVVPTESESPDTEVEINNVLDPAFLQSHNAEILCGPFKLKNCLDLSGLGGLITLTSPQLLNSKPRSLLLHLKGFENHRQSDGVFSDKKTEDLQNREKTTQKSRKKAFPSMYKHKDIKGLFENVSQPGTQKFGSQNAASSSSKPKIADFKGCDWFQELSVTIRVFKKTNTRNEKQQRNAMIQEETFHKKLIKMLLSTNKDSNDTLVSKNHVQNTILDILIWVLGIQMNDVKKRWFQKGISQNLQRKLKKIVSSCFIQAPRTTAHKCSRLLIMCAESLKFSPDVDQGATFGFMLLHSLLECFPLLPMCVSSGSMRWFFAMLNHVKALDVEAVAKRSTDLLVTLSEHISSRIQPNHALLKTRYGLYGNPFEADLFDVELNNMMLPSPTGSYNVSNTMKTTPSTPSVATPSSAVKEQPNILDMLNLSLEKVAKNQPDSLRNDIFGLLEVEPLHFRCHATSDGTRMERMDAQSTANVLNTQSGVTNMTPFHVTSNVEGLTGKMQTAFEMLTPHVVSTDDINLHKFAAPMVYSQTNSNPQVTSSISKPPTGQKALAIPQMQGLLQAPPPQVLVIERMHSGARRFITLDFGKPIVLTDIIIPSSSDLASLSIDVWVEGEEFDGQRLVVATDINTRTLIMNDIMPPPVCRYLKITTVGRYSNGSTRSRIRLGSFYGHTYILPWEWKSVQSSPTIASHPLASNQPSTSNEEESASAEVYSHDSLMSQLAVFISLLEDIQCRFNLSRTRLESLLTRVSSTQFLSSHIQYHLKHNLGGSSKICEDDSQIIQAYHECLQLQLQLNCAQRVIQRLQNAIGVAPKASEDNLDPDVLLKQACTDKLRVMLENVLDTLLTSTVCNPVISLPPNALYTTLTAQQSQTLFRNICLYGSQRIQVVTGLVLVRICGTQPWWGEFLGNILKEFFHSQFTQVFPQDRVFMLLSTLGQKSLTGPSALHILDSLLAMLTSILQPVIVMQTPGSQPIEQLDLSLISWVLLFLCRNLDTHQSAVNTEDTEKGAKKEKEAVFSCNNRWNFIESQWSGSPKNSCRHKTHLFLNKRSLGWRFAKSRAKFYEIERIRKALGNSDKKKSAAQLLDDVIESDKKKRGGPVDKDLLDSCPSIKLSRDRCLSVVKGLVALLLSMDFTCHVDLFLVTCKVLAKMCLSCRPAIALAEALSQEQLERLILLVVDSEFNHTNLSWGGPWASYAVTSLLQDILEGEKLCTVSPGDSDSDMADVNSPLSYSQSLEKEGITWSSDTSRSVRPGPMLVSVEQIETILKNRPEFSDFLKRDITSGVFCLEDREDPNLLAALFINKKDKDKWKKFVETVTRIQLQVQFHAFDLMMDLSNNSNSANMDKEADDDSMSDAKVAVATSSSENDLPKIAQGGSGSSYMRKRLLSLRNKMKDQLTTDSGLGQPLSTAVDSRLEFGLETMAEYRLKVMQSNQMDNILRAFSYPLPPLPINYGVSTGIPSMVSRAAQRNNEDTAQTEERADRSVTSLEMLSQCFEHLFGQMRTGRVSLDAVLQLWLTLNDDQTSLDSLSAASATSSSASNTFDATKAPVITLSKNAVSSLLEIALLMPCMQVRSWVFLLQSLCMLVNQRTINPDGSDCSIAPYVLNDSNLSGVLTKFLCSTNPSAVNGACQQCQVGPAAVKVFSDLLYRLQCKSIEVNVQQFKEMLIKIVYNLTAERGAIYQCQGPLDAQVQFLEVLAEGPVLAVDVSNALSVIQTASTLVYQHLSLQDQVVCRTSQDSPSGAKACFGGLVASLLRGSDSRVGGSDSLRDQLLFYLLKLVDKMIAASPSSRQSRPSAQKSSNTENQLSSGSVAIKQAWGEPSTFVNVRLSDDEKTRANESNQVEEKDEEEEEDRTNEIADIVVGNPVIMQNLVHSLSHCTSNRLALMFSHTESLSSLQKIVDQSVPVTVGDMIFTILRNLKEKCSDRNVLVDHLFHYFSGAPPLSFTALTRLSEPLLFFTLRTLNSVSAITRFIQLGGVEVVSRNFVKCNRHMISSSPSVLSTIMQSMSPGYEDLVDKNKGSDFDNTEGLQSFAHLGNITSSSPNANPADGLIQTVANRRARSATWSYHFYPDEHFVELTIHLPFAVLLKYVHIRPHGAAIGTCPSHVSLELSHDGTIVAPASPPLVTSSLTLIRLQLQKPEVVTSVTLLLHRPRDSTSIGLQKIALWGLTAFSEGTDQAPSLLNEESFSRSSLGWMRVLHHCLLNSTEDIQSTVSQSAAGIRNLLPTCTALLIHPSIGSHASKIESILIKMGLSRLELGLELVNSILQQPISDSRGSRSYLGRVPGSASPYTVEILYTLGISQDANTHFRVEALLQWLESCARVAVSLSQSSTSRLSSLTVSPSSEHVQCVAAILWYSVELPVTYPLNRLVTVDFVKSLYEWSRTLSDCNLRIAINNVLCAACHVLPHGFIHIQEWMGIVDANGSHIVAYSRMSDEESENFRRRRMTDDSKEAAGSSYTQGSITDDSKEAHRLASLSSMMLDESKLLLLASVCKSPVAIQHLLICGLPAVLAQAVCEFCNSQMVMISEMDESNVDHLTNREEAESPVTSSLVSSILRFFTEISSERELKDWLGQNEGNAFWSLLLTLLCGSQYQTPAGFTLVSHHHNGFLTNEERMDLESRTVQFFSAVIACHSENQLLFAKVLSDVIKDQGRSKTELLSAMPLSGFMRRLMLQVLLEDEKITVAVRNPSSIVTGSDKEMSTMESIESIPMSASADHIFHPRYGSGRNCQCLTMNLNARLSDVLAKVAGSLSLTNGWPEKKEDKKKREDGKKDFAGGEVDEHLVGSVISQTAAMAKEKREKGQIKSGLPPRPPTRRGRQNGAADSGFDINVLKNYNNLFRARLVVDSLPDKELPSILSLSQLLHVLSEYSMLPPALTLQFVLKAGSPPGITEGDAIITDEILLSAAPFPSGLQVFAGVGGLALLAEHLPLLFPEISRQGSNLEASTDTNYPSELGQDWVAVESSDELLLDPYLEPITPPNPAKHCKHPGLNSGSIPSIPPHSLIAFGLFLRLPGYAEVLLKERKMAQCLLRLVLGVTDDGDGGQILTSPLAGALPTMPFMVLKSLFDASPLTTDDGVLLRRMTLDIGVVHLVLACLATLSHHKPRVPLTSFQHETQLILTAMQSTSIGSMNQPEEKNQQHYWAKGTGFGTGSTTSSWDAEQAMLRQKGEEEHVACLLQVLASYISPNSGNVSDRDSSPPPSPPLPDTKSLVPDSLSGLLSQSCLVPALSSYLRNDSVLDMARHVPLYRALLQLLRGISVSPTLVPILLPLEKDNGNNGDTSSLGESQTCIETLLEKMKGCVDTYASRLKSNKGKSSSKLEDEESEGLALLIPDIQETARLVRQATERLKQKNAEKNAVSLRSGSESLPSKSMHTVEEQYIICMKDLQFDTYELVTEEGRTLKFNVPHHYESNVKAAGTVTNVARTRRLAQEAVTLSTSLPLAYSSSVFVRCDEERLDVMKVLITGPSETPYANGCFEFDVFFPHDYPNTPPSINMETTGNHSVRFNPNLYNDGKVCLSVLNTWHGRPEEKWNAQTSSFLQVLVSIQSLILVSEPYFNEPGYERSRGTPSGAASSHEYDANIRQATVKWAMLEQLRNPPACFKEVIHTHFWLKKQEILQQCENWIKEMEGFSNDKRTGRSIAQSTLALKRHFSQLREELAKLKPPADLKDDDDSNDADDDNTDDLNLIVEKTISESDEPNTNSSGIVKTDTNQETASGYTQPSTIDKLMFALEVDSPTTASTHDQSMQTFFKDFLDSTEPDC